MSCTKGGPDKEDHWAAGLEGGGGGRVFLQLDQLRCCHGGSRQTSLEKPSESEVQAELPCVFKLPVFKHKMRFK